MTKAMPTTITITRLPDPKDIPPRSRSPLPGCKSWATNEVECYGGTLTSPIIWQGEQWAVTGYGIERRDRTYAIEAERLTEEDFRWPWEWHMNTKANVDVAHRRRSGNWYRRLPS